MQLSQAGKIAQKHWQEIPEHFDGFDIDQNYETLPRVDKKKKSHDFDS